MGTFDIGATAAGAADAATGQIMQLAFGAIHDRRQRKQQKKLTEIQVDANKRLAEHSQALQFDMWNKTNYGAQVKHLKEAGLNPGLLYGMSGGGGVTTGSASAGSASGGHADGASAGVGMGIQMAGQIALLKAQTENIQADTELKKASAGSATATTENTTVDTLLKKIQAYVNDKSADNVISKINWDAQTAMNQASITNTQAETAWATQDSEINRIKETGIQAILDSQIKRGTIQLIPEQIKQIQQKILQDWKELDIKEFEARFKAEYPGLFNVGGNLADQLIQNLHEIGKYIPKRRKM